MATREFGTCFFEQYAQISLSALLGSEFDCLVNRDRPDLQSPDGKSIGIEVTRAMEESKSAQLALLKDVAGLTKGECLQDIDQMLEYGYGYGLRCGKYLGLKEFSYWSMALPMRRILESKVSKVGNGFYGRFDKMGLFVFCKDDLDESQAAQICRYTLQLQKHQELRYNRLYLADIDQFFVCNLDDGLSFDARLVTIPVTQEHRREMFLQAVRAQLDRARKR